MDLISGIKDLIYFYLYPSKIFVSLKGLDGQQQMSALKHKLAFLCDYAKHGFGMYNYVYLSSHSYYTNMYGNHSCFKTKVYKK